MVRSYLRYELAQSFGVISSLEGNVLYDKSGRLAITPSLGDVIVWNIRQGNQVRRFQSKNTNSSNSEMQVGQVTSLALSPDGQFLAAGYSSGIIYIFRFSSGQIMMTLDGHRSQIETLEYKSDGSLLVSGSRDTDIIVWDITSQVGLFRLQGHKNAVTAVRFILEDRYLVSSSKDSLLKVWDLETQHCVQTVVGHPSEIWAMDVHLQGHLLVTGTSDNQLRLWKLHEDTKDGSAVEATPTIVTTLGSIQLSSTDRIAHIRFDAKALYLGVQTTGKSIEIFKVRTEKEKLKKQQRREKRMREKLKKKDQLSDEIAKAEASQSDENRALDELELICVVRSAYKIKSFDFSLASPANDSISVILGLQNNSVESYDLSPQNAEMRNRYQKSHVLDLQGHRSDVRYVQLSSDNQLILSLSGASVKIWNAESLQCIRTLKESINLALCAMFAPGNMHVIVGTKTGTLLLFDINSGDCIWKSEEAHQQNAIWSMDLRPDNKGIATGGADQHVNFWDFEMQLPSQTDDPAQNTTASDRLRLGLCHTKLLRMTDDVLCVRYSHHRSDKERSKLLIAAALLDCTVKIFYEDSLKFFVSLYGHKLPVMSMDISSDDTLLITASADKNVKLWGLDFGDCHKSIFAHDDAIMCVRFVNNTHHFFTASKDSNISYWDGDHYERIIKFDMLHFGQVWSLAISSDGAYVISASQDRSLVKLVRTEDQVFLELERQQEMEALFDQDLMRSDDANKINSVQGKENNAVQLNSASASKRTIESIKSGDYLMEAIDLADNEIQAIAEHKALCKKTQLKNQNCGNEKVETIPERPPNMMLLGYSPLKYILYTMHGIQPQNLEEALLVLPIDRVLILIRLLLAMITNHLEVEYCCHVLLIIFRVHHTQVIQQKQLLDDLELLWQRLRTQLQDQKARVGFNLAGLRYIKRKVHEENSAYVIENDKDWRDVPAKKKKKAKRN